MIETVSEITQLWDRVLSRAKTLLNDQRVYDSFFNGTYIDSIEGSTMIVVVNTSLAKLILETKYTDLLSRAVEETTGTSFALRFAEKSEVKQITKEKVSTPTFFSDSRLDRKFTFESFVVGDSNREAYQAGLMISGNPGELFNPLVLYSDSGLGKTHLMQAIGNGIKEKSPTTKVLYISASDFVEEFTRFAQGYKEEQSLARFFKNEVDVLLIDDIQFLIGKKKTMEMFFVIFSDLVKAGKQIVITTDKPPSLLDGFDERLKSRFQAGLVISIKRPDLATSEEILRSKIVAQNLNLDDFSPEVISMLASRFSNNVRELEGALTRLLFYTINIKPVRKITLEVAAEAVEELLVAYDDKTKLSERKIIDVVADYYTLTPSQITGKTRTAQVALARHIAMYLVKTMLNTSYIKIGQIFGGRDHATAMKGVEKVEKNLKTDPDLARVISQLKAKLS